MKKKRFSVEQITSVLQQVAGGVPVGDVCRQVAPALEEKAAGHVAACHFAPTEAVAA